MLFVVHCLDAADAAHRRLKHYEAHKRYVSAPSVDIVMSGPLLAEDGETMIGSCFILSADSETAVKTFNENDPFRVAGVWDRISIHRFAKRIENRSAA